SMQRNSHRSNRVICKACGKSFYVLVPTVISSRPRPFVIFGQALGHQLKIFPATYPCPRCRFVTEYSQDEIITA
ncbi:MAG: hypothetical protein WCC17_18705, partial [Candidatus Nitrosopolaris sp.]